jgi:AraC-like DNA-binding protein
MRNAHKEPSVVFSEIGTEGAFPMEIELAGSRSDEPIRELHFHDALEIGYCVKGTGTFFVGAKILPYKSGDMTIITDLEMHRCQSARGTVSSWAWFFFQPALLLEKNFSGLYDYDPNSYAGSDFQNVISGDQHPELISIVKEMIAEAGRKKDMDTCSLTALVIVLLNRLARVYAKPGQKVMTPKREDLERISPALNYINLNYQQTMTIPQLASLCHMSVRNFQLVFMRLMECSPQEYLIRTRVRTAQGLLRGTDKQITEIAFECGFQSLSGFNRSFKKVVGTSPRAIRKTK